MIKYHKTIYDVDILERKLLEMIEFLEKLSKKEKIPLSDIIFLYLKGEIKKVLIKHTVHVLGT